MPLAERRCNMFIKMLRITTFIVALSPMIMKGQTFELSKRFDRSFKLAKTTEVNISNKYGNVHLLQWEKDSVRFEIEVNIRSSKETRVEKLYNEIDIQFSQTPYYVNAISSFAGTGKLWAEISDVTKSMLNAGNEAEINYTVWMPSWAIVKVENRFGNIYTTDHPAESEFKLSNGSLQAKALTGKTRITIAFGDAMVKHITDGQVELNYSELDLEQTDKINVSGKASTVHIARAGHLHLVSRRDKITVDKLESLSGESSFSRLELGELSSNLLLQATYGNLELQEISPAMEFLQLNASFTSIRLFLTKEQAAGLEIQYSKKARIQYPQSLTVKEEQAGKSENDVSLLKGHFGSGKGSSLKFNLTGGELNIIQR